MIRHIVMWKLKDSAQGKNKRENLEYIKNMLYELPIYIPQIKKLELGFDVLGSEMSWDAALVSEFDSMEDLKLYQEHPRHKAVSEYVAKVREDRAVVDYEF